MPFDFLINTGEGGCVRGASRDTTCLDGIFVLFFFFFFISGAELMLVVMLGPRSK